jgi:hypothetical protein
MSTILASFIAAAWNEHETDLRGAARRLADAKPLLAQEPEQAGAFIQLAEHLLLAHLGDTDAMAPWFAVLAPLVAQQPDAAPALARARLATQLLCGGAAQPDELPAPLRVRAHATAVNGSAARGELARARELLQIAATTARRSGSTDAIKALAACYNNLATQLLDAPHDPQRDALMLEAAALSRSTWVEAGTWLQTERADHVLALCAAKTGDGAQSLRHARSCLAICEANHADAFERCFAHQALGEALRVSGDAAAARDELAIMRALLDEIGDEHRAHAQSALDKLQRAVNAG